MLRFQHGQDQKIVVTFHEKNTTPEPDYYLVFTHVTSNATCSIVLHTEDNLSDYPERYDEFFISSSLFANMPVGEYHYSAFEYNTSSSVEFGKALLSKSGSFEFETYKPQTTYTAYNAG